MANYVLAHGAWSSAFAWRKMRPLMAAAGHQLWTPSLTGLGDRAHLAGPDIDLDTHIADIANLLHYEDLTDVRLIGHSYGGMVATGVADRVPERIRQVIYLDAFVPQDGQALLDLAAPGFKEKVVAETQRDGDGWKVKANPLPADTPAGEVDWLMARRHMQPLKTIATPIRLTGKIDTLPRAYIYCTSPMPGDPFRKFLERARRESWQAHEIDATHNPHITVPDVLMRLLMQVTGD